MKLMPYLKNSQTEADYMAVLQAISDELSNIKRQIFNIDSTITDHTTSITKLETSLTEHTVSITKLETIIKVVGSLLTGALMVGSLVIGILNWLKH